MEAYGKCINKCHQFRQIHDSTAKLYQVSTQATLSKNIILQRLS